MSRKIEAWQCETCGEIFLDEFGALYCEQCHEEIEEGLRKFRRRREEVEEWQRQREYILPEQKF